MKPTLSVDGKLRYNLTLRTRVNAEDIINGLCLILLREHDAGYSENVAMKTERILKEFYWSKAKILKAAGDAILRDGNATWAWSDDVTEKTANTIREQVRVLVDRKFPELKG